MRNIAICIGNRADGGPLGPVISEINKRDDLTYEIVNPLSLQLNHLRKDRFDWLLVLGDRHELLLACHSAVYAQIPIAHIHGGETTLGSFDDRVRNAVSQLATLHFTAAEKFSDKLRFMRVPGEIITAGCPGLDDLETDEQSEFGEGHFLVCLHPDTTQDREYNSNMYKAMVVALIRSGREVVMISPNSDDGGWLAKLTEAVPFGHTSTWQYLRELPRRRYLTALKHASVCIGNSSSFVIEAPALGTPTVLVGRRQAGRPMAPSITTVSADADMIEAAIHLTIGAAKLRTLQNKHVELPYGAGGASKKIAEVLATWSS